MEELIHNQYIRVTKEDIVLPNGQTISDYFLVEKRPYVAIVPIVIENRQTKIIIVKQFRPAAADYLWNIPMGLIDEGEMPAAAAARELKEEVGYCGDLEKIGEYMPAPSFFRSVCHLFVARNCKRLQEKFDSEIEEIAVLSVAEVFALINDSRLIDMTSVLGLLITKQKVREFNEL